MQNFGHGMQRTSILKELSGGNAELGEAFALSLNDMITQSGITNPKGENYEVVSKNWRALADKPNKTPEELKKLDDTFKAEIRTLAESYLLFMARETRNLTGKLEYPQYEAYQLKYRFGHYASMNKPEYISAVKKQLRIAFAKIAGHGEASNDNLIDKEDMAAFILALAIRSRRDEQGNFKGFDINGIIKPEEYAVNENNLFKPEDNLFSVKLRVAYRMLNNV